MLRPSVDVIIQPGSQSVISDLAWLKQLGLEHVERVDYRAHCERDLERPLEQHLDMYTMPSVSATKSA
jgi:cobyric acid synthase